MKRMQPRGFPERYRCVTAFKHEFSLLTYSAMHSVNCLEWMITHAFQAMLSMLRVCKHVPILYLLICMYGSLDITKPSRKTKSSTLTPKTNIPKL